MRLRKRDTEAPPLDGYKIIELMSFGAYWRPGEGRGRWQSWKAFCDDFRRLRPHIVTRFPHKAEPLYGDRVLAFVKAHGLAALDTASDAEIYRAI